MLFEIEGLDALLEQLDGLADDIRDAAMKGLNEGLKEMVARAKKLAPEDTGQLRNSITHRIELKGDEIDAAALATAEHAVYKELGTGPVGQASDNGKAPVGATYKTKGWTYRDPKTGGFYHTRGQPAEPFLYPAYKQTKDRIIGEVRDSVNDALKGGG